MTSIHLKLNPPLSSNCFRFLFPEDWITNYLPATQKVYKNGPARVFEKRAATKRITKMLDAFMDEGVAEKGLD